MSWLAPDASVRTLGDLLALRPDLHERYRALDGALDDAGVDPALLARCRQRIRVLTGHAAGDDVARPTATPADAAAIAFVEQFVMDPHGVDEGLVAALRSHLPVPAIVALAQAVAVYEGQCRLARAFDVSPER